MKTRTIILGLIVIIIIAIAVFLIYSLTHVSGFELRDEHRALIGMASPDTKSSGDCIQGDCTIANDKNKLNDMADFISEYSKKNPQGLCFKCNAGTPKNPVDVDSANKNNVFPTADNEADFWKARKDMNNVALTYSSQCVKGFYNCADVVLDDGKHTWNDISDCYSFGNGICGGGGARDAKCNPGPVGQPANLSAEGNCYSCTPGNVPETSPSLPKRCLAGKIAYQCNLVTGDVSQPEGDIPYPSWKMKVFAGSDSLTNLADATNYCGPSSPTYKKGCDTTADGGQSEGLPTCKVWSMVPGDGDKPYGEVYAADTCCTYISDSTCQDPGIDSTLAIEGGGNFTRQWTGQYNVPFPWTETYCTNSPYSEQGGTTSGKLADQKCIAAGNCTNGAT